MAAMAFPAFELEALSAFGQQDGGEVPVDGVVDGGFRGDAWEADHS
jgi:hypothetical protein